MIHALITHEHSGAISRAFAAKGIEARSCDLLPADDGSPHHWREDFILSLPRRPWGFVGSHPECTYLTNAGVRWLYNADKNRNETRWTLMRHAAEHFNRCLAIKAPGYVENPIPHKHALALLTRSYDQIVQPWMFGDWETKATCLWLRDLPKLVPTYRTAEACRIALGLPVGSKPKARVHLASPGPNRWKERSRTLPGLAKAMADQWSPLLKS